MSNEKLAAEIMYLSALVNANTELGMFIRYSGHVDVICVDISESKENYNSKVFDKEAYTNSKKGTEGLEEIRDELIQVLIDHNVFYETLNFGGPKEVVPVAETVTEDTKLEERMVTLEKEMADLKRLVSSQLEERGDADVSEELPSSRGDRHASGDRLEDRLQEAL